MEAAVSVVDEEEEEDLVDEEEVVAEADLETAEEADLETAEEVDLETAEAATEAVAEAVLVAVAEEAAAEDGGDLRRMYIKLMAEVKYTLFCYQMNEFFIQDVRLGVEHLQLVEKEFETTSKLEINAPLTVFVLS